MQSEAFEVGLFYGTEPERTAPDMDRIFMIVVRQLHEEHAIRIGLDADLYEVRFFTCLGNAVEPRSGGFWYLWILHE